MIGCPSCGAVLEIRVDAISAPQAERERWRSLRDVASATGQPVGRLRRLVRSGTVPARSGPRGAYLVRVIDVDAVAEQLPVVVPPAIEGDEVDELARLRLVRGRP